MVNRINEIENNTQAVNLRVCIDNVQSYDEVVGIVRDCWSARKVAFAITCPNHIAEQIELEYANNVLVIDCEDFSWEELHRYLNLIGSTNWPDIPDSVRDLLRKPLLASIYRWNVDQTLRPDSERALYELAWKRLSTRSQSSFPTDVVKAEALARSCFRTGKTHWDASELTDFGLENQVLLRLERTGWLIRRGKSWQIFHDRLLNWAIAQALLSDLAANKIDSENILQELETSVVLAQSRTPLSGPAILGDLMWLSSRDEIDSNSFCEKAMQHAATWEWVDETWFYDSFITALGSTVASTLLKQLKPFSGYQTAETSKINALKAIAPTRVCEFAKSLLNDENPRMQFTGLAFLAGSSCTDLVDRIWSIHVSGMADPKHYLGEHEQDWFFREISWHALRSTASNMPNWISNKIRIATSTSPCVSDLAWLLVNSPDANVLWKEHSDHLFSLLADSDPRVFVSCIGRFRDKRFKEWLKPRIQSTDISVSSGALHALSRINPSEAGNAVLSMDPFILEISASWSLVEVLLRSPDATESALIDRIEQVDDPWKVCRVFANIPNELPPKLLSKTLDAFEINLENAVNGGVRNAEFHRIFQMLQNLRRPSLVRIIEDRNESLLPSFLAQYTIANGPQKSFHSNGDECVPALELLRRMKSKQFCDVIVQFLQHGNALTAQEAVGWGMTFPDDRILAELGRLAQYDDSEETRFNYVANLAIKALIVHEKWEDAAHGIEKWGLDTLKSVTSARYAPLSIANEKWVEAFRARIQAKATPGLVLAIGFAGDSRDVPVVRKLLVSNSEDEWIRRSCINAMKLLNDCSVESIELVANHLTKDRDFAVEMLANCHCEAAWSILFKELEERFERQLAIFMIRESPLADRVVELLSRHLTNVSDYWFGDSEWHLLVQLPKKYQKQVLNSEVLREKIRRDAYIEDRDSFASNAKAQAIRCLSVFDPEDAFRAARAAFGKLSSKDREHYSYLLMELEPDASFGLLFEALRTEPSGVVRASIGRAISKWEQALDKITQKFRSLCPSDRDSACFLAAWFAGDLDKEIKNCLDDEDSDVSRAAVKATIRRRQQDMAHEIATQLQTEQDFTRKCCLLDDLIATADLGETFQTLPKQIRSAINLAHPFLKDDAFREIERLRKKNCELLAKEKR